MKLYQSLAEHYVDDIQAGRLPTGSRLPALRRVADQHGISLTTAVKAYQYLEQCGWIIAQPQSGFFVAEKKPTSKSPLLPSFKAEPHDPKACAPAAGYNPIVGFSSPLGTSMLSPELLPTQGLQLSIKRAAARAGRSLHYYPEPQGDAGLRACLAQHFLKYDFAFLDTDLVITNGCLHAIQIAINTVSKEGDALAISSPCFSGLLDLLSNMSRKIIEIPCTEEGLDLDQLEAHMREKTIVAGLFSTSHMNPTGTSLSTEQKQKLAALAAEYQIPVIEDDIYLELGHYRKPPLPAKHWDKAGYIIWCGSVSKTLAAGFRLGWCLPGRHIDAYVTQHKTTSFGVNTLLQSSLTDFINSGLYLSHLNKVRRALQQQALQYQQYLSEHLPDTARISQPVGGLVLWVQIPNLDAEALTQQAWCEKIDIRSGISFSTQDYYRDCFRVNFGWALDKEEGGNKQGAPSAVQQLARVCELVSQAFSKNSPDKKIR
ncbi:MAG: PLP-dependent aminotransferase family protein [Amphritea sp.]